MRPFSILVAAALAATALCAQAAGNAAAGRNKVFQCQGCHGISGWKTAFPEVYHVPKLGGQNPQYIVAALKEYRNGERDFATMRAIASTLSEQDMEDIAAYYGSTKVGTDSPRPSPAEKK
jgi:cytochrome c553